MDILNASTEWAHAEVFSSKIVLLLSVLFFLAALGFWQLGKTDMAKAFVWPLLVAGVLMIAVSSGLYFSNKPRIASFETAYKNNPGEFIRNEIARTAQSQNDLAMIVFTVLPIVIMAAALLIVFVSAPLWRAIGITVIALTTCLLFIDSNTSARNANYHQQLLDFKQ